VEEALSPFAHHGPGHVQHLGNLVVLPALGDQQNKPGPDHISIW
jgi:hypothetical protein